ncbi:unnamed protein product [Oncorhynchus mykiss]|uniref:Uncharacterized protein n=1 Tax=Oncorhynchus mykiss TaxID=8022 RepID=A0A060Z7A5_ONCMY|nr:unnamed protein product [Oncorhynchus mykiss]
MSRIRSTLNTVTKAVSGSDLLSKISRLKPSAAAAHAEKPLQPLEKPFMANVKPKQSLAASVANSAASVAISTASSSSAIAKQTLQLFQPEALSTNMDETYSTLSQHVNDYFGIYQQEMTRSLTI